MWIRALATIIVALFLFDPCSSFQVRQPIAITLAIASRPPIAIPLTLPHRRATALNVLIDVPDGFFTVTFAGMGLCLSIAKNFARIRMEENAWEQRLAEARRERLRRDPTLTEIDLRRQEAAVEWSAYGKPRFEEEQQRLELEQPRGSKRRVKVMERETSSFRKKGMSDQEIEAFEVEFGVDYDPYYDEPYTEEELPEGTFKQDRFYGDRTYDNGEIFFKDKSTGLYYRQGAKPRNISFFS